jgi:hypothetical protein
MIRTSCELDAALCTSADRARTGRWGRNVEGTPIGQRRIPDRGPTYSNCLLISTSLVRLCAGRDLNPEPVD